MTARLPSPLKFRLTDFLLRVVRQGQHFQGLLDFAVHHRIEEADPLHIGHLDGAHAFGAPEIEELGFDDFLAGRFAFLLDAHDDAGEGAGLGGLRLLQDGLDLFAAGLVEDLAEGRVVGQVDGEGAEGLFDRGLAVVVDGGDVAAAEVLQDHALEQVVDVLDGEAQIDAGIALDFAFALEVADAAGEQHHLADRQLGGRRPARFDARGFVVGACRIDDEEKAGGGGQTTRNRAGHVGASHDLIPRNKKW